MHSVQHEPNEVAAVKWMAVDVLQKTHSEQPETILAGVDTLLWDDILENLRRAAALGERA